MISKIMCFIFGHRRSIRLVKKLNEKEFINKLTPNTFCWRCGKKLGEWWK